MFGLMNTDKYTQLTYDRSTGGFNRSWIQYADDTFEPVRKNEFTSRKKRHPDPAKDWWVTEKPQDWDPQEHGFDVTLNHDYGEKGSNTVPRGKKPGPVKEGYTPGQTAELRLEDMGRNRPMTYPQKENGQDQLPPQTTLALGKDGYREFEERRKAAKEQPKPRNSAQDAAELNRRENRERSSAEHARDLEQLEKDQQASAAGEAASASGLGGMVQSKGQHGKGKLNSDDPRIKEMGKDYKELGRDKFKKKYKKNLNELSNKAKKAKSPKERKKILKEKDAIKGALKLFDRYMLKTPLMMVPFSEEQMDLIQLGVENPEI